MSREGRSVPEAVSVPEIDEFFYPLQIGRVRRNRFTLQQLAGAPKEWALTKVRRLSRPLKGWRPSTRTGVAGERLAIIPGASPPSPVEPALWDRPSGGHREPTCPPPTDPTDLVTRLFSRPIRPRASSFVPVQSAAPPAHVQESTCILLQAASRSVQRGRTGVLPDGAPPALLRGYVEGAPTYRGTPSVSHA